MKIFTPLVVLLIIPFLSLSQSGGSPIPYYRYAVSGGGGINFLYGDLNKKQIGGTVFLRGHYFVRHGLSIGLELQEGLLRSKEENVSLPRRTENLYHAGIVSFRFQPFKYMQDDHMRRTEYRQSYGKRVLNTVYAGLGAGAIYNLQWNKQRAQDPNTDAILPGHEGSDSGLGYFFTTELGVEIPLHSLHPNRMDSHIWSILVNGQVNFALDDEIDGYSGGQPANTSNDVFGVVSIGLQLRF